MARYSKRVRTGTAPPGAKLCDVTGKWGWDTREAAEEVMRNTQANPKIPDPPKRSYECPWCERHHLTNDADHPLAQEA